MSRAWQITVIANSPPPLSTPLRTFPPFPFPFLLLPLFFFLHLLPSSVLSSPSYLHSLSFPLSIPLPLFSPPPLPSRGDHTTEYIARYHNRSGEIDMILQEDMEDSEEEEIHISSGAAGTDPGKNQP